MDTSSKQGEHHSRPGFVEKGQAFWNPPMNIEETAREIILEIELPGMSSDEIELTVTGDTLQVSGEKRRIQGGPHRNYYVMERVFGPFHRGIQLPSFVDPARVTAEFTNGILSVVLPKVSGGESRVITVRQG